MTSHKPTVAGANEAQGTETKEGEAAQEQSDDLSEVQLDELLETLDDAQTDALLKLLNIC
jgi:hypothetical protein